MAIVKFTRDTSKGFVNSLNSLKKLNVNKITQALAENGKNIANDKYNYDNIHLQAEIEDNNIVVNSKLAPYIEYGTGYYADGTYLGELPTETLTFKSGGEIHSTQGWDYYYDNSKTKKENYGKKGWYLGKHFTTGRVAGNQLFNTATELREQSKDIVKKIIKGDSE